MKNYINSPIYLNCSSIGEAYNSIIENFSKYREYVSYPTIITITNTENTQLPQNVDFPFNDYYQVFMSNDTWSYWSTYDNSWYISYSRRIFQTRNGCNLWEKAKEQLVLDCQSRRSIIQTFKNDDDVNDYSPSLLSLQFVIDKGYLNLITCWRSKEGTVAFPINAINMCYLLKKMYIELLPVYPHLVLGSYTEVNGSMHKLLGECKMCLNDNLKLYPLDRVKFFWSIIDIGKETEYDEQYNQK